MTPTRPETLAFRAARGQSDADAALDGAVGRLLEELTDYGSLETVAVCTRIRQALSARSGKPWSVTRGRGTSSGWITISSPPRRQVGGELAEPDRAELATLLGLSSVHIQGVSIPASHAHYREFIDRAEGRTPARIAEPYWD